LPDHLPREDILLDVEGNTCSCCGGALHPIGESVSEMLDWVPAQLRVVRIARPKYACRACNTGIQAAAPERLIAGGLATPALLAQVLISKHCDHTPLYRQSQIFARHGVDLSRSTLADWVGACWWLEANGCARTSLLATICSRTTRRSQCSILVVDERRQDVFGSIPVSSGRGANLNRKPQSIRLRRIVRPSARHRILRTSKAPAC
jgi:transposase